MKQASIKQLQEFSIFRNVAQSDLMRLSAFVEEKKFTHNEYLLQIERAAEYVYFLQSGTVEVYIFDDFGKKKSLGMRGTGEVLGEIHGIDGEGHSANVVATESCRVWAMSVKDFRREAQNNTSLLFGVVLLLAQRTRFSTRLLEQENLRLSLRVVNWLLEIARPYIDSNSNEVTAPLRLTQNNLAEMVGGSREKVGKVLCWLKVRGIISFSSAHHLTIHDVQQLQSLAREGKDFTRNSSKI